jgi:hypothetical protein
MFRHALLCVAALAPVTAPAQDDAVDYGSIDGFYAPHASVSARWPAPRAVDDDGDGFGIRTLSRATDTLMVLTEYQHLSFEGLSTDQLRIGAGLAGPSTTGVYATYDRLDLDGEDANALGLHLRVAGRAAAPLTLYGAVGYLLVDAETFYYDGVEITAGAAWDLPAPWGLFVDYRATLLDDHDRDDALHHEVLRAGLRFRFDC